MYLKFLHDIENNIFSTAIIVDSFGTEQLSEDEEKELLKDFPSKVAYRALKFTKNVEIKGNVPEVTATEPNESTVVAVTLPALSNKEILLNECFEAVYHIDVNKISPTAIDEHVLKTKELVAQAYCIVFDEVIREAVENIMKELRTKAPAFTGEKTVEV